MKNRPLGEWWNEQKGIRECVAWLKHDNADAIAAKALFHLNRGAKENIHRDTIYSLKTVVIKNFYDKGFCTSVQAAKQDLHCFACEGSGEGYDEEYCERCSGSGIYSTHYLYTFTFNIAGQRYQWHQPQSLVTWHVETTTDELANYENLRYPTFLPNIMLTHYLAVLYAYLRLAGIRQVPEQLTFREGLKTSFRWWWQQHYSWAYPKPLPLRVINAVGMWIQNRGRVNDYSDIPF